MNTQIKDYINGLLSNKPNPVILEIGTHYGEDTVDMLKVFNDPMIYCFEPDPRNVKFLNNTLSQHSNVKLFDIALYNKNGEEDFNMSYQPYPDGKDLPEKYQWINEDDYRKFKLNNSGSSSLKSGHKTLEGAEKARVKTMRLDTWAETEGVTSVDFIWMDVQDAEREVIEGGQNLFSNTFCVWTEYGETGYEGAMTKKQTIKTFKLLGFHADKKQDNNILFTRDFL